MGLAAFGGPTVRAVACAVLLCLGAIATDVPVFGAADAEAQARSSVLRSQSRVISGAINRQIRRAFRPTLRVRNSAGDISAIAVGGQRRFLSVISEDGSVRVWDLKNGRQLKSIAARSTGRPMASDAGVLGTGQRTRSVDGGRRIVIVGGERGAMIWDALSGQTIANLRGHRGGVNAVRLSPDGRVAATGGADGTVRLWDTARGRQSAELRGHRDDVTALAFSPSGHTLVSGDDDGTLIVWDTRSGRSLRTVDGHRGAVTAIGFGRDDGAFFSGGEDGDVEAWTANGDRSRESWSAGRGDVTSLDVAPNGTVVTATDSERVTIWRSNGRRLQRIEDDDNDVVMVAFTADGKRIITGGEDGRAKIWDVDSGRFLAQLILTRDGWAVTDANGRFDGSTGGVGNVDWVGSQATLNIANFSEPYYEPGLLAKTLEAPQAIITQNAVSVEEEGVGVPPSIVIQSSVGTRTTQPGEARVTVVATDEGAGIQDVRLYQNGKLVDPARIVGDSTSGDRRSVAYGVALIGGRNGFRAVATSIEGIEGEGASVNIEVRAADPQPTLHLVAIGVNRYANPQLNLNYAVADASGFVQWAQRQGRRAFREVKVYELFDTDASADGITSLLGRLRNTDPEDVVVIYMAGHGETSGGNWYFLPTEFGRTLTLQAVASQGVASQDLRDAIVRMGAQKVFMLIDACKSGSMRRAFGGEADRKDIQSMSRTAGIHVIAATDKNQLAVELSDLGHGAFTYTVLQALQGQADLQPRDGVLKAMEVLNYSVETVPAIAFQYSEMEQFPTVYSQGADFQVAATR